MHDDDNIFDLDRILALAGRSGKTRRQVLSEAATTEAGPVREKAPPGWTGTVKAMKKRHKEIDNPYALAWYMKNHGDHSHKTKSGKPKHESTVVREKWDTDHETPESEKGKWNGWSKERLEKRRDALRAKDERSSEESTELKQINFALRAKNDWGKAD